MPCLNEVRTVPRCVRKAVSWLQARAICGEVIVADNGSTDGSIESSEQVGGRVVRISNKGYGNALMGGIEHAHGKYLIMGTQTIAMIFPAWTVFSISCDPAATSPRDAGCLPAGGR